MITAAVIRDDAAEVLQVIRWYLWGCGKRRKRRAMWASRGLCGNGRDVEQYIYCQCLAGLCGATTSVDCKLTTYVCNVARWSLHRAIDAATPPACDTLNADVACEFDVFREVAIREREQSIRQVLTCLTYRHREIINMRYGLGDGMEYRLGDVGKVFRITRERVRQLECKAIRRLQHPSTSRRLKDWATL